MSKLTLSKHRDKQRSTTCPSIEILQELLVDLSLLMRWSMGPDGMHLNNEKQRLMLHVLSNIRREWPTSPIVTTSVSIKYCSIPSIRPKVSRQKWTMRIAIARKKEHCFLTVEYCRQRDRQTWGSTGSSRLD